MLWDAKATRPATEEKAWFRPRPGGCRVCIVAPLSSTAPPTALVVAVMSVLPVINARLLRTWLFPSIAGFLPLPASMIRTLGFVIGKDVEGG